MHSHVIWVSFPHLYNRVAWYMLLLILLMNRIAFWIMAFNLANYWEEIRGNNYHEYDTSLKNTQDLS